MGWWNENGFAKPGQPVPGMPGFVYNSAGGIEPIDGTPNGEGETTDSNGVSRTTPFPGDGTTGTGNGTANHSSPGAQDTVDRRGGYTGTNPSGSSSGTGNRQQDVMAILQRYPHTPAGLQQALPEIQRLFPGVRVMGSKGDKLDFGDGHIVDVIISAGLGGTGWTWQDSADGNGGGGGGFDPFSYAGGSLLTPWTEDFVNPYGDAPTPERIGAYQAPAPYKLPSWQDLTASDPGIQFRINQGRGALENSAASRRVLHTGGTLKDLVDYGQNAASQEYGAAAGRDQGVYALNTQTGLNSYTANAGATQTNNQNALTNYNTNYANAFQRFLQRYNQFRNNKTDQFSFLSGLAGM